MNARTCQGCGEPINLHRAHATTCSTKCRVRVHRAKKRAEGLASEVYREKRWVRAQGKVPMQTTGRYASSTDGRTWSHHAEVQDGPGDGYGVMLGGGVGCYDLDNVSDEQARDFIAQIPEPVLFSERSLSGKGVHVFIAADESIGWRNVIDGVHVERYTRSRFIRMTGNSFS